MLVPNIFFCDVWKLVSEAFIVNMCPSWQCEVLLNVALKIAFLMTLRSTFILL